jgi:hypothetical protein
MLTCGDRMSSGAERFSGRLRDVLAIVHFSIAYAALRDYNAINRMIVILALVFVEMKWSQSRAGIVVMF